MSQRGQAAKNPLDPEIVLSTLENVFRTSVKDIDLEPATDKVLLRSGQDALAALFHSIMLSLGFRLVGLDEDDTFGVNFVLINLLKFNYSFTHVLINEMKFKTSGDNIDRDSEGNILGLPENWNIHGPNSYSFRYKHPQSSFTFLIKCIRLANKLLIHGMGVEVGR